MNFPERIDIKADTVEIPVRELCSRLGFLGESEIPDQFKDKVKDAAKRTRKAARPTALVIDLPSIQVPDGLRIGDIEVSGELARKHLGGCSEVSVILLTLGGEFDRLIYSEPEDHLGSFFLDGIGSELAEYSVRELDRKLRERRPDMVGSSRISPGYGDLSLSLNRDIVRILNGGDIGVFIVEGSFEMSPRKTISAFIGWRKPQ
jgi:hypothetical protein